MPGFPNPLLVGEVFREYSRPWEGLARRYIKDVWDATKSFVEQALHHLTDTSVSDALLRHLLDPIMDNKLKLAYAKLDELVSIHKEHPETRNHYFTDTYNALQRKQSATETTNALEKAFAEQCDMTEDSIPFLVAMLQQKPEANMEIVAAESTYNAMEAFYKVTGFESIRLMLS